MRLVSQLESLKISGGLFDFQMPTLLPSVASINKWAHKTTVYSATAAGGVIGGLSSAFGGGYLAFQGAHGRLGPLAILPGVLAGGIGLFPGFVAGAASTGVTAHFGFTVVSGIAGWLTADSAE